MSRARTGSPRHSRRGGSTLVELLVGAFLAMLVLAVLTGSVGSALRLLVGAGHRGELDDTAQLVGEAFAFDARRAGFDPAGAALDPLPAADASSVVLQADLDRDGLIDGASEERTTWRCDLPRRRVQRVLGTQATAIAGGVAACAIRYRDGTGTGMPAPPGGLDPGARARVRAIELHLALQPASGGAPATATTLTALRTAAP